MGAVLWVFCSAFEVSDLASTFESTLGSGFGSELSTLSSILDCGASGRAICDEMMEESTTGSFVVVVVCCLLAGGMYRPG